MYNLIIIGGGVSGLACARWAKTYGLNFLLLEKNSDIGGVWCSNNYPNLRLQVPKEDYKYYDFDYPKDTDDYPTSKQVLNYLYNFIRYHDLKNNLLMNIYVQKKEFHNDYWSIYTNKGTFQGKYIALCVGNYQTPYIPKLNYHSFNGVIIKPSDYNNIDVTGKTVVIIGNGPTGVDLATDAVKRASRVIILYRTDKWISKRHYKVYGINFKNTFCTKDKYIKIYRVMPKFLYIFVLCVTYYLMFSYYKFKLNIRLPGKHIRRENVVVNDDIFDCINDGSIKYYMTNDIKFDGKYVVTEKHKIKTDVVILATGYKTPKVKKLYKLIIDPDEPNCGHIGFGSTHKWIRVSDIQARWFVHQIVNGFPKIDRRVIEKHDKMQKRFKSRYDDLAYTFDLYKRELDKDL